MNTLLIKRMYEIYNVPYKRFTPTKLLKLLEWVTRVEDGLSIRPYLRTQFTIEIRQKGKVNNYTGENLTESIALMMIDLYDSYNRLDIVNYVRKVLTD